MPVSEMLLLLTALTLPEAMVRLARKDRAPPPPPPPPAPAPAPGKLPRVAPPPAPPGPPVLNRAPPPGKPAGGPVPDERLVPRAVQLPDDGTGVIVIERAAIVVLDFFEGVPVTVRQSLVLIALTVSLTVLEKAVVPVQLTVVWPVVLCTSMEDALSAATLPSADPKLGVAAPESGASVASEMAHSATPLRPAAAHRPRRRAGVRCVRLDMAAFRSFFRFFG
jgi:hypothetical protein